MDQQCRQRRLDALSVMIILSLGLCSLSACSSYRGPITNQAAPSGSNGLPGLTREFAP